MNRPVAHKTRRYTLVEILVAMAILVIMMSFLFQFVIGAQRIWSASTRTSSVFDKAQIVFDVIETDLKNAQFSDEPGREVPLYRNLDGTTNDLYFGMISNFSSSEAPNVTSVVGTFPVLYFFDHSENELYRCAVDVSTALPWYCFGMDVDTSTNDYYYKLINDSSSPYYRVKDTSDLIADGVENFVVQAMPSFSNYATTRPKAVKITLTLYDPEADKLEGAAVTTRRDETRRVFTKIIFMQ